MSWARVPEWVTVHTLECRSCLNVGSNTQSGERQQGGGVGGRGRRRWTQEGQERSTKGFILPLDWGGEGDDFTLLDLLKKKEKEKRKRNPNTASN